MAYAITADFYLGFYQGRDVAEAQESYPTPARLYSALLAAAFSLERLEDTAPGNPLSPSDTRVFSWLESNPPDAVMLPKAILASTDAVVYRDLGETVGLKGTKKSTGKGKSPRPASVISSLFGPVCWYWNIMPENGIAERLDEIAHEVPYLGEAVCPVRISTAIDSQIPSDALVRCNPSFSALSLSVAETGRLNELEEQHQAMRARKFKDSQTQSASEQHASVFTGCVGVQYYRSAHVAREIEQATPWRTGYYLSFDCSGIPREDYTSWAVCLHQALSRYCGDGLPRIMQRAIRDDDPLPNGLAIQMVTSAMPIRNDYLPENDSLLVMIPQGASIDEEMTVVRALSKVRSLFSRYLGSRQVSFSGERLDLSRFWKPIPDGYRRLFETEPLFISNNRPPTRAKKDGSRWNIDDDARVAIGYVWRDCFPGTGNGDAGRVALAEAVSESGIGVCGGHIVPTSNIRYYVHHVNRGSMLVGAHALVDLSATGCSELVVAIGQTRHLGGGLLVPFDIPEATEVSTSAGEAIDG